MKKQQLIGFLIISFILFIYIGVILPKYTPPPKPVTQGAISKDSTGRPIVLTSTTSNVASDSTGVPTSIIDTTLLAKAQEIIVDTDLYRAKFTTLGGRLTSFKLKEIHTEKTLDISALEEQLKEAVQKNDEMKVEFLQAEIDKLHLQAEYQKEGKEAQAKNDLISAENYLDKAHELDWVELVTSSQDLEKPLEIDFSGIPNADKTTLYSASSGNFKLDKNTPKLQLILQGTLSNGLLVEKTLNFTNDNYILPFNLRLYNPTDKLIRLSESGVGLKVNVGAGIGDLQMHSQSRYDIGVQPFAKVNNKVKMISISAKTPEYKQSGDIEWAAMETNYFFKGLVPQTSLSTTVVAKIVPFGKITIPTLWIEIPTLELPVKSDSNQSYLFYIGPKQSEKLTALNVPVEEILFYHPWFGWLQTIDLWILIILKWLYALSKNYGVAIILISVLFKVVTFPLTHISFKSMKGMQKLGPEMKALQEKYKDDPARQQKEVMALYKKHGVNPMTGCLPLFIQMPIFIALYAVLGKAIELRGAPFIWWITDLAKPDTIMYIAGFPLNILPIFMGATMWLQQKMTTTPDPKNAMMSQMMTVVFLFIFWSMPSGLVLYWFVSNILSILQQHYINKQDIPVHLPHAHSDATK